MDAISNTHDRQLSKNPIGLLDAFGRLRVSGPYTLFDAQNRYEINNKFYSNVSGNASVSYISSESTVLLTVGTGGGSLIRESKNVFAYQPGKSLLILNTCVMSSSNSCTQRVGYFNDSNGVFLERSSDGTVSVVIRNNGSEDRVTKSNWNTNKCPGLDLTKAQIFWTDIEWLGVGSVRTGFVIDGVFVTAHVFHHANRTNSVYMTTAILPVRYEISGTSGSMKQICSSVISEGGYDQKLPVFSQIRGTTTSNAFELVTAGTVYPLISIRLKSTRLDSLAVIKYIDILSLSNQEVTWYLVLNPVLTSPSWTAHAKSTNVEVDVSASAISGGTNVFNGYAVSKATVQIPVSDIDMSIGRTHLASDIITLAASGFSNNTKIASILSWIEI
jgi:hypothetical protein